ncbi:MAG: AI-2E family transporter [Candidatus Kuenenbacteria bacterium]
MSIIRVILVLLAVAFIYLIRDALALLFVSIIFASAIGPWVDWLHKYKFPRGVSVIMIYAILLSVFSLIIVLMVPPITDQVGQMAGNIPSYYEKISFGIHSLQKQAIVGDSAIGNDSIISALQTVSKTLAQATKSIFVTITSIFGGLLSLFVVLVVTFYIVVEDDGLKKFVKLLTPSKYRFYTMNLIDRMQLKIGLWLRGQLLLCLLVGILVYIGLALLGVKYALVLALLAGILEIVPYFGPWISAIPALFVASGDSLFKVLAVAAWYLFVQQMENNIVVPKIMQKVVGLNPIIVIMAIVVGVKLGGIVGAMLGVPVAAAIAVYVSDALKDKKGITL